MATVMIVPRDTAVGDLIGEFVTAAGHHVVYATDDEAITQRLQRTGATIALVDIEHMNADEVTIAHQLRSAGVPVIVVSGRLVDDELRQIAGSSATATFALPGSRATLARQLDALGAATRSQETTAPRSSTSNPAAGDTHPEGTDQ
jgi:DNA-binding response OmpR family regulator